MSWITLITSQTEVVMKEYFLILMNISQIPKLLAPVSCKVDTGYHATSKIEHVLSACTVDNPLAKARG